jgi:hypothetical protein
VEGVTKKEVAYGYERVVLHEALSVACEQAEEAEYES